jgi:hypothetical protein
VSNPAWEKKSTDEPIWEGPTEAEAEAIAGFGLDVRSKILTILEAMDWTQLLIFKYGDSDRIVAPYVVGISSEGNPLMRGFQLEGISRSGKVGGWRVFQVKKIENLDNNQEYFDADDFDFDRFYPWIFGVIKML